MSLVGALEMLPDRFGALKAVAYAVCTLR